MDEYDVSCWKGFIAEGDNMLHYMMLHFEKMLDGDTIIKHFSIRPGIYGRIYECDTLRMKEEYGTDIQKQLIPWIRNEINSGHLFDVKNWKPFRDLDLITWTYMGYRKMFQYNQYYFQLALESMCGECVYCHRGESSIHFEAALCGWKDDRYNKLQPDNYISILPDNIIPKSDWMYDILVHDIISYMDDIRKSEWILK